VGGRAGLAAGLSAPLCPELPPPGLLGDVGSGGHVSVPGDAGGRGASDTVREAAGLEHPRGGKFLPGAPRLGFLIHTRVTTRRQMLVGRGPARDVPAAVVLAPGGSRAPGSAGPHPRRGRWCRPQHRRGWSGRCASYRKAGCSAAAAACRRDSCRGGGRRSPPRPRAPLQRGHTPVTPHFCGSHRALGAGPSGAGLGGPGWCSARAGHRLKPPGAGRRHAGQLGPSTERGAGRRRPPETGLPPKKNPRAPVAGRFQLLARPHVQINWHKF